MKRSTYVLIAAIIIAVFGLGFLISPNTVLSIYGSKLDTTGEFVARYFGSALIGLAVTWFMARGAKTIEDTHRGGYLGGLVLGVTGLLVAIWDVFAGTHNSFVWANVAIYAFFAIGFAYCYFKKRVVGV